MVRGGNPGEAILFLEFLSIFSTAVDSERQGSKLFPYYRISSFCSEANRKLQKLFPFENELWTPGDFPINFKGPDRLHQ